MGNKSGRTHKNPQKPTKTHKNTREPTRTHENPKEPTRTHAYVILSKAKDLGESTTLITNREILHSVQNDKRTHKNSQERTRTQKNPREPTRTHAYVILSKAKDLGESTTLITNREILHSVQNDKRTHKNPQKKSEPPDWEAPKEFMKDSN